MCAGGEICLTLGEDMLDYRQTAVDWANDPTDIIVLPVGALEQHGSHLPLDTDTTIANYAARIIAEHFRAALLPALPIATSFEHSGYRGTFSLRPETLMAIIRDLSREAEEQSFRIMIVVNGHGGNFSLAPVIRDINRQDRPLKILLSALSAPLPEIFATRRTGAMDMHSGEIETSIMMHITGRDCPAPPSGGRQGALEQPDLNTFGIGWLNDQGVPGHPELASREKGAAALEIIFRNEIARLQERITMLRENPRYHR